MVKMNPDVIPASDRVEQINVTQSNNGTGSSEDDATAMSSSQADRRVRRIWWSLIIWEYFGVCP